MGERGAQHTPDDEQWCLGWFLLQKPSATESSLLEINKAKKHWHVLLLLPVQRALCLLALQDLLLPGHQAVACCRSPRGLLPAVTAVTRDVSGPKAPRAAQQPACALTTPAPFYFVMH